MAAGEDEKPQREHETPLNSGFTHLLTSIHLLKVGFVELSTNVEICNESSKLWANYSEKLQLFFLS